MLPHKQKVSKKMKHRLNTVNDNILGLKIHKGITKCRTITDTTNNITMTRQEQRR